MGLRFRKTVSLGKGLRLNISRSGVSTSVGPRGASVTFGKNGAYANVGLPGTGISYRQRLGRGKKSAKNCSAIKKSVQQEITAYTGNPHYSYDLVVDDNSKFILVDGAGNPINDTELIKLIRKDPEYRQKKSELENQHNQELALRESDLLSGVNALLTIHEKSPLIKTKTDYEYALAVLQPKDNTPEAKTHFERKRRRLKAALHGDPNFIEYKTGKWFEVCELPFDVSASFQYESGENKLSIDLDLPEVDVIPSTYIDRLSSGKLKEKNKSKKQTYSEYERLIKSLTVYIAASLMNVSIAIRYVVMSGFTSRRDKSGSLQDECILSVMFDRQVMSSLNYREVEPESTIAKFANRQNVLSTGLMKAIDPL